MKTCSSFGLSILLLVICLQGQAQIFDTNNVVVQTFAGSGFSGYYDGQGAQTMFNNPSGIVADTSGNLFVWDQSNLRVRKITPDGVVSTFAGGGNLAVGYGTNITLDYNLIPALAIDHSNCLWLCSANMGFLVQLRSDGYISKVNFPGPFDPRGVCADSGNNLYVSSGVDNRIFRYRQTNGVWEVFAGSGNFGAQDGNWIFSSFYVPTALASDLADNIYVWDSDNHLIRRINQNRDVVTVTGQYGGNPNPQNADGDGPSAGFYSVSGMCVDNSGNLVLACGWCLRKVTARTNVTTIAGSFGGGGYTNGPGNLARFNAASGVCIVQSVLFVADMSNQRIRNVTFDPALQPVSAGNLSIETHPTVTISGIVGRTYRIESSLNLTNWGTEAAILLTTSPYLWMDPVPLGQKKFYRAALLP